MTRNNDAALESFTTQKVEIDTMLSRLQALSDDHFNTHPDEVTWSDAEGLAHIAIKLLEICDQTFGEGEYAK